MLPMLIRARNLLLLCAAALAPLSGLTQTQAPLPDVRQLMKEVQQHQKQLDQVRETYTYTTAQTTQDLDASGKPVKTETVENENFFVNGHVIARRIKKNGQPLDEHDQAKESERLTKIVAKAEKTPPGQPLEGQTVSITRILEIMDVGAPRRESLRGRPTIVFDFTGRKDAKTHGMIEDASKKLKGTIWIDEADRQVAHLDVIIFDNVKIGGGLLASVQKGSNFKFDQGPVEEGLWLPTAAEANMAARVLLLKNMRQHFTEQVYGYKRFKVDTQQMKDAKVLEPKR